MQPTRQANQLAELLQRHQVRLVLAESCTAGLVAATLGAVSGISNWLCGSSVVYRDQTKMDWLGIREELIVEHTSVSEDVTSELALAVLEKTQEASMSAAVTGHLGPNAPASLDGTIFIASVLRAPDGTLHSRKQRVILRQSDRGPRQDEAVEQVIDQLIFALQQWDGDTRNA